MNSQILNKDVQDFLEEHLDEDLDRVIFRGSPFPDVSVQELAGQLQSRKKCRTKLPSWFRTPGILYPQKISIEQASSEETARYKADLVQGESLADLAGGFGVDAYFFSKRIRQVTYCELNENLKAIAEHNFQVLGAGNINCLAVDGIQWLRDSKDHFQWIYVDPARRSGNLERVFLLEDCSPNILENLDLLLSKTDRLLVKLSPLLDISRTVDQLPAVKEIHVLAHDNEVKELLFVLCGEPKTPTRIHAVNLKNQSSETLSAELGIDVPEPRFGAVNSYLYEPNAAIMKAGLFSEVAMQYDLVKLHPNSHLYTSEQLIPFPGRRFRVIRQLKYSPKKIRKELGFSKANITTRNFHDTVARIRKRTGLVEGGEHYLFFTTDHMGQAIVLDCSKAE